MNSGRRQRYFHCSNFNFNSFSFILDVFLVQNQLILEGMKEIRKGRKAGKFPAPQAGEGGFGAQEAGRGGSERGVRRRGQGYAAKRAPARHQRGYAWGLGACVCWMWRH